MIPDLPSPPVVEDCDLRDFQYMPLDVARLRDSELASSVPAAECWYAVLLWCAAWHQVPAGSLPDDDRQLAKFAGFGRVVEAWEPHRAGALYGWVKCADGRLHHPVVAEKAHEAWQQKRKFAWKRECDRIRKINKQLKEEGRLLMTFPLEPTPQKYVPPLELAVFPAEKVEIPAEKKSFPSEENEVSGGNEESGDGIPAESSLFPAENPLKGTVREHKGNIKTKPLSGKPDDIPQGFIEFWNAWPKTDRKVAKADCLKKWKAKGLEDIAVRIVAHVEKWKKTKKWQGGYEPAPLTYINQQLWLDDDPAAPTGGSEDGSESWRQDPRFKGGK